LRCLPAGRQVGVLCEKKVPNYEKYNFLVTHADLLEHLPGKQYSVTATSHYRPQKTGCGL
jgi:hypothetical protein